MNGMKNIAEYRKSPRFAGKVCIFFLMREKKSNFTLTKQKETAFSTVVIRMEKQDVEVNSNHLFQS